jgi:hypothetical protein
MILYRNRGLAAEVYLVRCENVIQSGFSSADVLQLSLTFKQIV